MVRLSDSRSVQIILGVILRIFFIGGHILVLPFLLVAEQFVPRARRGHLWRRGAQRINQFVFWIMGLRIHRVGVIPAVSAQPRVYVSNHPTMIDGFIYFSFLGPELIPLTAPAKLQIFPFNIWFPKMGIVDVARDAYDAVHCTTANERHEAIRKLIAYATQEKKSLLIFPEGHVEWGGGVHYIHTGAARVALSAQIPVVPLALTNMDQIFLGGLRFRPGRAYVHTHAELKPPQVTRALPYRHATKLFSTQIASALYSLLPSRAIPRDLYDKNPKKIGVFVDIDRTLYHHYSQQAFLKYLQNEGVVSRWASLRLLDYLILEKIGVLSHELLMNTAYRFTRGWRESDLAEHAARFFKIEIIPGLVHNMIPILKDHSERGHQIFLVSEVIRPLARQFKEFVGARDIASTRLQKHAGRYTGKVLHLCFGEDKAIQTRRLAKKYKIDLGKSYAYGDSPADFAMLKLVKHPVAVRPKKALKHEALLRGWPVVH